MNQADLPTSALSELPKKELKKYNGSALRIMNALIGGATQEQAAKAVGVDPSYVSQLCAEEDFQLQVVEGIQTDIEKSVAIDKEYLNMEFDLVNKLKTMIPWMTTTDQVLKCLRYLNEAKRKSQHYIPNTGINGNETGTSAGTATIIVPTFIQQNFITTPNREIVGIDGKDLVTLDSKALNRMITSKQQLPNPQVTKAQLPNEQSTRFKDPWSDI